MSDGESALLIDIKNVCKSFNGNVALHPISLQIRQGDFHALIGENGAGKSTFINLITGTLVPDEGEMSIGGKSYKDLNPKSANELGIFAVHQELSLCKNLTITQNIFLGNEIKLKFGLIDKKKMISETKKLLKWIELAHIDPEIDVKNLSLAEAQLIEFAKVIYRNPKLLILDEATSALNNEQVGIMFRKLRELREESNMAIIFISHRLKELYDICNIMTVLKDGAHVVTKKCDVFDQNELVTLMTGREPGDLFPQKSDINEVLSKEIVLSMENVKNTKSKNITFELHKGEILGIGGLQGQGQQEVLKTLFGADRAQTGTIYIKGKKTALRSPLTAMKNSIAYLPAERKSEGLFLIQSIKYNNTITFLDYISKVFATVSEKQENKISDEYIKKFSVKCYSKNQPVGSLSGGNQQKVCLSKWLYRKPEIILLNEPTRGIDVGVKKEIYELLRQLSKEGVSVILVSSDTLELIGLCDRVIVMYENEINTDLKGSDLNEDNLVRASVFKAKEEVI